MKIAIVTGASSGMGREFVRQLSGYVSVDAIRVMAMNQQKKAKNNTNLTTE